MLNVLLVCVLVARAEAVEVSRLLAGLRERWTERFVGLAARKPVMSIDGLGHAWGRSVGRSVDCRCDWVGTHLDGFGIGACAARRRAFGLESEAAARRRRTRPLPAVASTRPSPSPYAPPPSIVFGLDWTPPAFSITPHRQANGRAVQARSLIERSSNHPRRLPESLLLPRWHPNCNEREEHPFASEPVWVRVEAVAGGVGARWTGRPR